VRADDLSMIVLPALLVAAWLTLWVVRRRVGWRFFAVAFGVSVLYLPAGLLVAALVTPDDGCRRGDGLACVPGGPVGTLIVNAYVALWCCAGLLALTVLVNLVRLAAGRLRRQRRALDRLLVARRKGARE
jgi:hypothetical protein